jgi:hypothetical protein
MNAQDSNRRFAKAAGICRHMVRNYSLIRDHREVSPPTCSCRKTFFTDVSLEMHIKRENPDFCADPRLVLEVMMKREDWLEFWESTGWNDAHFGEQELSIPISYILDTTGLLALKAISWLEKQTEGGGE